MRQRPQRIMIARKKIRGRKRRERQKLAEKQGQQSKRLFSRKEEAGEIAGGDGTPKEG